jgi:membrane-bound inhibitor of C-type lysozyme
MKKILMIGATLLAFACSEKNKETSEPKEVVTNDTITKTESVAPSEVTATTSTDNIFISSVTNNAGITLKQSYNKTKRTAVFEVNGETIIVRQDTVASGIQYSNDHDIYKEHKGDIAIYKDGKLFWDNIR